MDTDKMTLQDKFAEVNSVKRAFFNTPKTKKKRSGLIPVLLSMPRNATYRSAWRSAWWSYSYPQLTTASGAAFLDRFSTKGIHNDCQLLAGRVSKKRLGMKTELNLKGPEGRVCEKCCAFEAWSSLSVPLSCKDQNGEVLLSKH